MDSQFAEVQNQHKENKQEILDLTQATNQMEDKAEKMKLKLQSVHFKQNSMEEDCQAPSKTTLRPVLPNKGLLQRFD